MASLTVLIVSAIYLLPIAAVGIPECEPYGQTTTRNVLKKLIEEVIAKLQEKGPKYDCKLEQRAYDIARNKGPVADALVSEGPEDKFNIRTVVKLWKDQLPAMSNKDKFGCNFRLGNGYKVACVFE